MGCCFNDDVVGVGVSRVDGGLREEWVGGYGEPFNWDWHVFVWGQVRCVLLILNCPRFCAAPIRVAALG